MHLEADSAESLVITLTTPLCCSILGTALVNHHLPYHSLSPLTTLPNIIIHKIVITANKHHQSILFVENLDQNCLMYGYQKSRAPPGPDFWLETLQAS